MLIKLRDIHPAPAVRFEQGYSRTPTATASWMLITGPTSPGGSVKQYTVGATPHPHPPCVPVNTLPCQPDREDSPQHDRSNSAPFLTEKEIPSGDTVQLKSKEQSSIQ